MAILPIHTASAPVQSINTVQLHRPRHPIVVADTMIEPQFRVQFYTSCWYNNKTSSNTSIQSIVETDVISLQYSKNEVEKNVQKINKASKRTANNGH